MLETRLNKITNNLQSLVDLKRTYILRVISRVTISYAELLLLPLLVILNYRS